jgi:hypothetical protein
MGPLVRDHHSGGVRFELQAGEQAATAARRPVGSGKFLLGDVHRLGRIAAEHSIADPARQPRRSVLVRIDTIAGLGKIDVHDVQRVLRQPPPIDCVSSQFLFYLNSTVASTAFQTWSRLIPQEPALLPPERFHFDVLDIGD